jgi:hypothetical protein
MKKMYLNPEMEIFDLEMKDGLLASSPGYDAGGDDTEWTGGNSGGADNPGFGGDY